MLATVARRVTKPSSIRSAISKSCEFRSDEHKNCSKSSMTLTLLFIDGWVQVDLIKCRCAGEFYVNNMIFLRIIGVFDVL